MALLLAGGALVVALDKVNSGPTRVLLIGDSLMAQAVPVTANALNQAAFSVRAAPAPGTGLLDTKFNWLAKMQQLVDQYHPNIVIAEFLGNYGLFGDRPGIVTPAQFFSAWHAAAQQATDILSSQGAHIFWVLGPPVSRPLDDQKVRTIARLYKSLTSPPGHGTVSWIDEFPPFTDSEGHYIQSVQGPGGAPVPLRTPDGTHLSPVGAIRFSAAIVQAIIN